MRSAPYFVFLKMATLDVGDMRINFLLDKSTDASVSNYLVVVKGALVTVLLKTTLLDFHPKIVNNIKHTPPSTPPPSPS